MDMINDELKIINKRDEVIGVLVNDESPESCPYYDDLVKEKLNDFYKTFEFKAPADHPEAEGLQPENKIALQDREGKYQIFRIKRVEDEGDADKKERYVFCEHEALDLLNNWVRPGTLEGASAEQFLNYILSGTKWQPGIVEWAGTRTHSYDNYYTSIEALSTARSIFGGDIRPRIEIRGARVVARYIDLVERLGSDSGGRFEYESDLLGLTRTESTEDLATALIGIGKGDQESGQYVTFSEIEWSIANGDPADKPLGQDWIGDPEALNKWGDDGEHLTRTYRNEEVESPEELLQLTWQDLQKRNNPAATYKILVLLLDRLTGYEHKKRALGDTIRVTDFSYSPPLLLEGRINVFEWSKTDPTRDSVEIGDYKKRLSRQYDVIKQLQETIQINRGKWETAGTEIIRSTTAPENLEAVWIDTSKQPNIVKSYNTVSNVWEKATPTSAAEVGAETPSGAQAKANAAQAAAINAAAQDASQKAGAAEAAAKTHADQKAAAAQAAAEAVAVAEADAAQTAAEAHADGIVSAEEQARIQQANDNLAAAKADATSKAAAAETAAKTYAEAEAEAARAAAVATAAADAQSKADAAQAAAEAVAVAEGNLAETNAKAHADGIVDAEEAARIQQDTATLNAAKTDAQTKADAAKQAAITAAAADAKAKADAAQAAAIDAANAETALAETRAKAYADGEVDKEEQARIDQAAANLAAAKTDATNKANSAEAAAKAASEASIYKQSTAPAHSSGRLWLDTSKTPNVLMRSTGTAWVKASPTTAAEVGAETPAGAQAKANAAQAAAEASAEADAAAAETRAKAYADGEIDKEEARAIADAQAKADAAKQAAISAAATDAQTKADAAKQAAIDAAYAETALAETRAKAYADGEVTKEEQARIDQAAANLAAAKSDATTKANAAETAAKNYSEQKIHVGTTAPASTAQKWLDTTSNILKAYINGAWRKTAPENATELKYLSGTTLEQLKPAAAGADVTGNNTAADTTKVNGTAASTVKNQAAAGQTAQNKISGEVGTGTIENTGGSQSKANTAETNAKNAIPNTPIPAANLTGLLSAGKIDLDLQIQGAIPPYQPSIDTFSEQGFTYAASDFYTWRTHDLLYLKRSKRYLRVLLVGKVARFGTGTAAGYVDARVINNSGTEVAYGTVSTWTGANIVLDVDLGTPDNIYDYYYIQFRSRKTSGTGDLAPYIRNNIRYLYDV